MVISIRYLEFGIEKFNEVKILGGVVGVFNFIQVFVEK